MKLLNFKHIRTRLTFWFLLLALAPLLSGILITYYQNKKSIEQETLNKLTAIRDLKVQQLEGWLDARIGDLKVASGDFEIRALENIFDKKEKSTEDIEKIEISRELLNRYLKNYNAYEEIFIIGANTGLIEISTNPDLIGENKSRNTCFTVPLENGQIFLDDIYYSKNLKQPQMTFSIPIYCLAHNTHIIGILVARIDLENSLYNLLANRAGLGETGETLIVNEDAVALNELRWFENAPLNLQISAEPAVNAAQGKTGITVTTDYRGEDILAAYTYIPETRWGFVCKQDMYELNAPIRALTNYYAILLIISALVVILIVYWISKKISKPIVDMNKVANKIIEGDYTVRNITTYQDELGSLASSFNEMTSSIKSRNTIQQGISDISNTMIGKSSMQEFGADLLEQLMEITKANMSAFYILNEAASEYEHFLSIGANKELFGSFNAQNLEGEIGNAVSKKKIYYLNDIPEDTIFKYKTTAGKAIPKEIITIPILVGNTVTALISLVNIQSFSNECLDILEQSWPNINTSFSNLIANERTQILAEHLSKTNQQLEAQTEELQDQAEELQDQTEELQRSSEELQEQNTELEVQRKQVESANKLKSEFLSNMSHELRTPLNSIMALSRVLIMQAKKKLNNEENNYLEIIERNGKRLLSLINSILDLSKIESGKMEVFPKYISISTLLQLIKENIQTLSEEKNIALNLTIPDTLPNIETDESRLHQVLLNIVSNAVKFTKKGAIEITAKQDSKNVIIEVKDSGIGIPKEVLPHIFDEFRQADGTSSRQYEGTGLGLAIAYKLTQVLGGIISVKSKLGVGSTFTISIPIKWYQSEFIKDSDRFEFISPNYTVKTISTDIEEEINSNISEARILIVEDNPDAIIQLKAVLKNENYKVDIADGGQAALNYLQHSIPDGIILDLMMPDIDGFDVLNKIRNTKETKNIPVLILTAKDLTKEDLSKLSSNNVQQLIHKGDVDIDGLLSKVRLMLGNTVKFKPQSQMLSGSKLKNSNEKKKVEKPIRSNNTTGLQNILVIEDKPDNMITIKAILKNKYNMAEAVDGEEGLKMVISLLPDLVLLDMSLPKMDGKEIVKILRANKETRNISIIAVTAQAMKGDKERFLELGCDGYIPKPIDPVDLLTEIDNLLKK